jgi:folate-binding protein YgfZ
VDAWSDAQIVSLEGHAVRAFLQGYLTCNSERIEHNAPTPMALCNLKGRVIANGWAIGDDAKVQLIVHGSIAASLATFLQPYAMFSKCKVEALTQAVYVESKPESNNAFTGDWCFAQSPEGSQSETDRSDAITSSLIAERFALVSEPVAGKFLPQVLGMHEVGAVDFDKGCYLGQEIVARAQFRGAVKRGIDQFSWQGDCPAPGSDWEDEERGKGTVVSAFEGTGIWVRSLT